MDSLVLCNYMCQLQYTDEYSFDVYTILSKTKDNCYLNKTVIHSLLVSICSTYLNIYSATASHFPIYISYLTFRLYPAFGIPLHHTLTHIIINLSGIPPVRPAIKYSSSHLRVDGADQSLFKMSAIAIFLPI